MPRTRDWSRNRELWIRVLVKSTGEGLETWNRRIRQERLADPDRLREWLEARGVAGYARTLLVMERFGYPDFLRASADELIDRQYADRAHLRPIYDAVVDAAENLGPLTIQARKTYVSLVTPRRTFARLQPTTQNRVDLGLRIERLKPGGRLRASRMHQTMKLQVALRSPGEVDDRVVGWLRRAYQENGPDGAPAGRGGRGAFDIFDLPTPRPRGR